MEVDLGELANYLVEQVRSVQFDNLHVEVELVDDFPSARGEAGDVSPEVPGDLSWVMNAYTVVYAARGGGTDVVDTALDAADAALKAFISITNSLRVP